MGARTTLNAEGILSLKPTLLITTSDAGPPQVIEQLKNSGVKVLSLTPDYTVETVKEKVQKIAEAIGAQNKANEINARIDKEIAEVKNFSKTPKKNRK